MHFLTPRRLNVGCTAQDRRHSLHGWQRRHESASVHQSALSPTTDFHASITGGVTNFGLSYPVVTRSRASEPSTWGVAADRVCWPLVPRQASRIAELHAQHSNDASRLNVRPSQETRAPSHAINSFDKCRK